MPPSGSNPKVLSAQRPDWIDIAEQEEGNNVLDRLLRQILMAEHLVVLAGLGSSRCIQESGKSAAPTMEDLWAAAKEAAGAQWDDVLEKAAWTEQLPSDIELLLSRCQMAQELHPDEAVKTFIAKAEQAVVSACQFVDPGTSLPTHEAFLRKVARRSPKLPRTQLFTTNYDLAFETAASNTDFAVIDGFSHTLPQRFNGSQFGRDYAARDHENAGTPTDWVPNVVQLHKLHGSVDWTATSGGVHRDASTSNPLIIYPRSSKFKLSYQQPFLELMSRFQAALRKVDVGVLIIGSGFNDTHVTEPVMAAIQGNVRLAGLVVGPQLSTTDNASYKQIESLIEKGDRRFALLEATFEDFVPRIPELMTATEAEQHAQRVTAALESA